MNKRELRHLAILGIAAGTLVSGQNSLEAVFEETVVDIEQCIAKPKCKAHGGCGGLTASRDLRNEYVDEEESLDGDEDEIYESPEGDDEGYLV